MRKTALLYLVSLIIPHVSKAQSPNAHRKRIQAVRTTTPMKIDGQLTEAAWNDAEIAKDFVMMRPTNGQKEPDTHKTEVKLLYDNNAIYISAVMHAPDPSKIPAEFSNRDNIGNADFFLVTINPIDDGQNPFQFIVTSSGVQADAKVSNGNEDFNWSAVWDSSIQLTDNAWIVEMKIPYRALRFANQPVQSWAVNFHRRVQNLNAQFTWNHIDNTSGNWTQYDGLVENLKDIKPPTRLTLYPYASGTVIDDGTETTADWSVGMDIKYGITENFTLDATLIPDFGQAAFDNVVLNLGPFEQQFTEQRQFFTEGTELFTKGRLFYSRRIGGKPIDQFKVKDQLADNEEILEKPDKVDMLNAVKVSGRTKKGLGIGLFNAITDKAEATIINKDTQETRKLTTNSFANYNIMVLDQQFNQNSAITLINTNVTRVGEFRDANVSGLLWHVEDKKSRYNIDGSFKMSAISDDIDHPNTGYSFDTSIGKHAGNWRGEVGYQFDNSDYNINDLGIQNRNNTQTLYGFASYQILQPTKSFNNYRFRFMYNVNYLHKSGVYTGNWVALNVFFETKDRFAFGGNVNGNIGEQFDYFEPRQGSTSGIYFIRNPRVAINHWGSTDYRKKLAFDYSFFLNKFFNEQKFIYGFRLAPRYRFNNQFSLIYNFRYRKNEADRGYVKKINEDHVTDNAALAPLQDRVIFGERDIHSYENTLSGKYSFNANASLSLTFRHNWEKAVYDAQFYTLKEDGYLEDNNYNDNHDVNFNSWNLDLNYTWQFAPGSQLIAFYRNSINPSNDFAPADVSFSENLERLFDENMKHTFSLRLVYFIDYNNLKNIF
ncbi:DUF5916 domain-containing protein [Tenacibaculum sp. 190524A02b]|uniref:DUF5916 domain-containing protein n=1 Tax=Tenacibaculum vairaonense TaxID=3137860 RepID=UPI0031FAAD23